MEYTQNKTMEAYCANCKKNTASKYSSPRKTTQNRLTLLSDYAVCGKIKSRLVKKSRS